MNMRKNILAVRVLVLTLASMFTFSGCGYVAGSINDESIKRFFESGDADRLFEVTAIQDTAREYLEARGVSIPVSDTSIYVNRLGYNRNDEKKAIFSGDRVGDEFNVVNADSGNIVYTGKITGDNIKQGDFSPLVTVGRFYIETSGVGRSYYFTISDNATKELFTDMLDNFYSDDNVINEDKTGIMDACFGMDAVIYAMQCNGEAFDIDNNLIQELLHMSDNLIALQGSDGSILDDYESTAAFCGIICMCANEFGKYDNSIDKTYKAAAVKAWKWMEKNTPDTEDVKVARFYAASQLFNITGGEEYRTILEEYMNEVKKSDYVYNDFYFYGIIAYMSSKGSVDKELCTSIMMAMLDKADDIADNASDDKVYKVGESDIDEIMTNTVQICLFNYLVPSREYTDLISNTIEYIGGYNPSGTNYMDTTNDNNYEYKGIMLFAISNVITED